MPNDERADFAEAGEAFVVVSLGNASLSSFPVPARAMGTETRTGNDLRIDSWTYDGEQAAIAGEVKYNLSVLMAVPESSEITIKDVKAGANLGYWIDEPDLEAPDIARALAKSESVVDSVIDRICDSVVSPPVSAQDCTPSPATPEQLTWAIKGTIDSLGDPLSLEIPTSFSMESAISVHGIGAAQDFGELSWQEEESAGEAYLYSGDFYSAHVALSSSLIYRPITGDCLYNLSVANANHSLVTKALVDGEDVYCLFTEMYAYDEITWSGTPGA